MKKLFSYFQLLNLIFFSGVLMAQTKPDNYSISKLKVGGDGGWDYPCMDDLNQRLFISHGNIVQVLNVKTGEVVKTIPDTKGVHGIALAPDLNKGFISNGRDTSVTIFNLTDLNTLSVVKVTGNNPDAILYDPFSHKVFTFNGRSNNATVIDANSAKVLETIPLEGKPEFAVTDGAGKVFVNIEDKNMICFINPTTMRVERSWPIARGEEPSGLAIDNKNHRLFIVCGNKLMIILDSNTGDLITKLPIGENVDGVAFDPVLERAYSSNGEGTITVVQEEDANHFNVLDTMKTQKGARTIALSATTHHLYLPTAEFGPPPEPTKENAHPRPAILPGTFVILDIKPDTK